MSVGQTVVTPTCLCRPGEDHRSVSTLLRSLQTRLEQSSSAPGGSAEASAGGSAAQPLHIMLQVQSLAIVRAS